MQNSSGGPIVSTVARRLDHPLECIRGDHLDRSKCGGVVYHEVAQISEMVGSSLEHAIPQRWARCSGGETKSREGEGVRGNP